MRTIAVSIQMNDLQYERFVKMLQKAKGMHYANLTIRKDGADIGFEADWIKDIHILDDNLPV